MAFAHPPGEGGPQGVRGRPSSPALEANAVYVLYQAKDDAFRFLGRYERIS
ncbi:hypothetical protein [Streptomyces sp. NPDC052727]|uniref:hypothetical protein n=1 Tax=unclassified Streptomyces TaxID=2593676 RepID=UPI003416747B